MLDFALVVMNVVLLGWVFYGKRLREGFKNKVNTLFGNPPSTPKDMGEKLDKIIELLESLQGNSLKKSKAKK